VRIDRRDQDGISKRERSELRKKRGSPSGRGWRSLLTGELFGEWVHMPIFIVSI